MNPLLAEESGIGASQVSVTVDRGATRRRFRATVMARGDGSLTLLTAAHCVEAEDVGTPARLTFGEGSIDGTFLAIARNPAYRSEPGPGPVQDAPGADNAVALLRVDPGQGTATERLRPIRPASELTRRPVPAPTGQAVEVLAIDAGGREYAVRAGNFSNPRWLEWGPAYRPVPGDSGGGVFVLRRGPDGRPRPVLIGVIVVRSDRGGGASLVSLEQRWLAEALAN